MSKFNIVFGVNIQLFNSPFFERGCEHSIKAEDNFCSFCGKPAKVESKLNLEKLISVWSSKTQNKHFLQWNDELNNVSELKVFSISFNPGFGVLGFALIPELNIENLFGISQIFSPNELMKKTIQSFLEDHNLPFNEKDMSIYSIIENI